MNRKFAADAKCRHCPRRRGLGGARGLCQTCFKDLAIRKLYPATGRYYGNRRDETEADLDAIIAEQMQCLPAWWAEESARGAAR